MGVGVGVTVNEGVAEAFEGVGKAEADASVAFGVAVPVPAGEFDGEGLSGGVLDGKTRLVAFTEAAAALALVACDPGSPASTDSTDTRTHRSSTLARCILVLALRAETAHSVGWSLTPAAGCPLEGESARTTQLVHAPLGSCGRTCKCAELWGVLMA